MLFNSFEFLVFFVLVFAIYIALQRRWQNVFLLAASYTFYGAWDPRFLALIAASTVIDYVCGLQIGRATKEPQRRLFLGLSVCANLGALAFFKYYNFFAASFAELCTTWVGWAPPYLDIVLPVGISFYTFQTMSYTIDVYRREVSPTRSLTDLALYVAFFPQLVAGPIERAKSFLPQIQNERRITYDGFNQGCWLILFGLFKKVVIADNLAPLADAAFDQPGSTSGLQTMLGIYAFAFQIYGDFSGYTDIARGTSKLLGFDLRVNFRAPYFAVNPSDFWKRWHISLSSWLRDYLYIPLGGSRGGRWTTYRNLSITMLLGGLWHGAAWTFVAWGAFHAFLLVAHRSLTPSLSRIAPQSAYGQRLWTFVRVVCFFHLTCVGWTLFRARSLADVGTLLRSVLEPASGNESLLYAQLLWMVALLLPLVWLNLKQESANDLAVVHRWRAPVRFTLFMLLWSGIVLCGVTDGDEFLYFQF